MGGASSDDAKSRDACSHADAAPIGPGRLVLVVGPSGSGKDTLLRLAAAAFATKPDVVFAQRIVTRAAGSDEANLAMSPAAFSTAEAAGEFALTWHAHGLSYGVPAAIDAAIREGRTVVVNASRTVAAMARDRYAAVRVVLIDAPPEVRASRLLARGRETALDIARRLDREPSGFAHTSADVVIVNDATPDAGATRLIAAIRD